MQVIPVPLDADAYDVLIGEGLLATLPDTLRRRCPAARYAVIADATVAGLYGDTVAAAVRELGPCDLLTFPAGEQSKNRDQWTTLTDAMTEAGIGRDGAVVALGGGVTGDLAGFVAATYRRGIPVVQIPTSFLAMVDSAVGGKTGLDTRHGKNLVGAFHQPRVVVADVGVLRTLPDPHLRAGLAEALKHGAIADRAHFEHIVASVDALLARDPATLETVIARSISLKAGVVGEDEREQGRRAILNFGHTIGHAIEAASDFRLLHGEAVAMGMVAEAALGTAAGITRSGTAEAVAAGLGAVGLPVHLAATDRRGLQALMGRDKKTRGGTVKFAFLQELGQAARSKAGEWTFEVSESALRQVLDLNDGSSYP